MASQSSLTERLNLFMRGDLGVVDSLLQDILPTLHEIAVRELKRERYMAPVSKTELIHEVWLRNLSKGGWQINDQGHFYALASLAMRRVLIEMARKRLAARRGAGASEVSIEHANAFLGTSVVDAQRIVDIGLAMDQLEAKDSDAARVVDMHYFSGFTLREIAEKMGLGVRSVRTLWGRGLKELEKVLRSLPDLSE
jgi:RNA polymerase sigma factor (TIGR02999 family)